MVRVFIEREKRTADEKFAGPIRELLGRLGLDPETVVVVKNGEVVTEDERCGERDEVKLLSVVSGG